MFHKISYSIEVNIYFMQQQKLKVAGLNKNAPVLL